MACVGRYTKKLDSDARPELRIDERLYYCIHCRDYVPTELFQHNLCIHFLFIPVIPLCCGREQLLVCQFCQTPVVLCNFVEISGYGPFQGFLAQDHLRAAPAPANVTSAESPTDQNAPAAALQK